MSSDHHPRFTCPTCGKSYRWKPEMAGRSAKCGCGGKLVVPAEPPATARAPASASAPVATPRAAVSFCPSCAKPLAPDAVLCVNCGYNLKTGQKLSAVVVETGDDEDERGSDDRPAGGAATKGAAPNTVAES